MTYRRVIVLFLITTSVFAADRRHVAPREFGPVMYRLPVDGITALVPTSDGGVWYLPGFMDAPFAATLTRYEGVRTTSVLASQLVNGDDGSVWASSSGRIERITPDGATLTYPVSAGYISQLTIDSRGLLWFTNRDANLVGYVDHSAQHMVEYPLPSSLAEPRFIAPGPDGNMWLIAAGGALGAVSPSGEITEFNLPELSGRPVTAVAATPSEYWLAVGCRSCNRVSCPFPNDRGVILAISATHQVRVVADNGHNNVYALASGAFGRMYALKAYMWFVFDGSFHPGPLLVIREDGSISELAVQIETTMSGASSGMLAVSPDGAVWGAYSAPNIIFRFPAWQVR